MPTALQKIRRALPSILVASSLLLPVSIAGVEGKMKTPGDPSHPLRQETGPGGGAAPARAGTPPPAREPHTVKDRYDIVVYGGTSGGIVAAVQAARLGHSVILIEPGRFLGGLTTGGLGATDTGNRRVIGGVSREFYQRIRRHYEAPEAWTREEPNLPDGDAMWRFEPKVARRVFEEMLYEAGVPVVMEERLILADGVGVRKEGTRIQSIHMENGKSFRGRIFIDSTYEGDLMALAGVSNTTGREGNEVYGETLNGVQVERAIFHQFEAPVDPYIEPGNPESGLLPGIESGPPPPDGTGDHRIQAYCFRMCLTDDPENKVPFPKPDDYDPQRYELLLRSLQEGANQHIRMRQNNIPFTLTLMPNRKTDSNNAGPVSLNYIGMNYDYPEGDYETREAIVEAHRNYQMGLVWFLTHDERVPEETREAMTRWGLPADEFTENDHWPPQLYIREARRMISDYVMTEQDCFRQRKADDPVGMGSYNMDSHNVQRYVSEEGEVRNEGDVQVSPRGSYLISYRSIVPKREECTNLFVPVSVSSSHIAFGSIRMEPVFMILAHSAATAASLALEEDLDVQEVPYPRLRQQLLEEGQRIDLPER